MNLGVIELNKLYIKLHLNKVIIPFRNENGLNNIYITKIGKGSINSPHLQMGVCGLKTISFSYKFFIYLF